MATQVQRRGGSTSQHSTFTGAAREITIDTDKKTVVVHDGATPGGFPLKRDSVSATDQVLGRSSAGAGPIEEIPLTAAGRTLIGAANASAQRTALGLGTAAPLDVAVTGDASATQVVKGNDSRLSDSRTPTAHTQAASTISDSTTAGRALLTAADAAAQRSSLGLGTAATAASTDFLPTTFTAGTLASGALDMAALAGGYRTLSLSGDVTFTTSNRASGRQVTVRIVCDATQRNLTFPAGWVFVGTKPSSIAASKTAVLSLTFFGTADSDCVAAYGVQA